MMKWLLGGGGGVAALLALAALAAALGLANRGDGGATIGSGAEGAYRGSEPPAQFELVDFALRDHEGALVRSSSLRAKVVVLTFLDSQ